MGLLRFAGTSHVQPAATSLWGTGQGPVQRLRLNTSAARYYAENGYLGSWNFAMAKFQRAGWLTDLGVQFRSFARHVRAAGETVT